MQTAASEIEVLCAEEASDLSPALFLPEHLEKIVGTPSESTVPSEIDHATRRKAIHAATIAYHLRDAALVNGSIYCGSWRHSLIDKPNAVSKSTIHFDAAGLASTWCGAKYFGHWLKDDCVQYLLAEEHGKPLSVSNEPTYYDMNLYASYFGQDWAPTTRAQIDHLVVYQDLGQNSSKKSRYRTLQDRLAARLLQQYSLSSLVYLKRGRTGHARLIQNEDEIVKSLTKNGFSVVDVAATDREHVIATLMNAEIVVSIEGSHMSHCWFPSTGTHGLIALQPPDRFTAVQRGWAHCMSARFGFVVGDKRLNETYFSPSDILRVVDLMIAQSS